MKDKGYVYLIHFAEPIAHARHYMGAARNLEQRLSDHKKGRGSRLLEVANELGIDWWVVRLWQAKAKVNPFHIEKALKGFKNGSSFCPECYGERVFKLGLVDKCHQRMSAQPHPLIEHVNTEILKVSRI